MLSADTNHSGRYAMETFFITLGVIVLACIAVWLFVFEPRRKIYDL
jgi:Mn2+/Fe2+ NRAMP family transporter